MAAVVGAERDEHGRHRGVIVDCGRSPDELGMGAERFEGDKGFRDSVERARGYVEDEDVSPEELLRREREG